MGPGFRRVLLALVPIMVCLNQGCGNQPSVEENSVMTPDTVTFLALGDSYTIGESVDSTLRWPVQLAEALQGEGVPIREPIIVARTGWTTDELADGIAGAGITGTFDLVSLLIGVNNQYRGLDGKVHTTDGHNHYSVLSTWDTFRAAHPLYTLVTPDLQLDVIKTMIDDFKNSGWGPRWKLGPKEVFCMPGSWCDVIIPDAYVKGITDFDTDAAWNNYSFTKMLTPNTSGDPTEGQYNRSRKLAYVCFSRSEKNLRILLFTPDPETAKKELVSNNLFEENQISIAG